MMHMHTNSALDNVIATQKLQGDQQDSRDPFISMHAGVTCALATKSLYDTTLHAEHPCFLSSCTSMTFLITQHTHHNQSSKLCEVDQSCGSSHAHTSFQTTHAATKACGFLGHLDVRSMD
jgi:hypothetical protein